MTPYEVIYAKPPPSIPHYILGSSNNEAVNSLLSTRDAIHASLKRRLLKVQAAMKKHADMKWRDVDCEVGQWVYVKLCPYRQLFVIGAAPHKLVKRYFGPFLILEHVGNVAYHLQLLKNSKIHLVFYYSLLPPHHGPLIPNPEPLLLTVVENQPVLEPLSIPSSKTDSSTDPPTRLVLVQWLGLAPKETTWEKWDEFRDIYHLKDKVTFSSGGNDSNTYEDIPEAHVGRPIRSTKRLVYLDDYA